MLLYLSHHPCVTPFYYLFHIELLMRIELTTSSLPRKCSTPELQQLDKKVLSGRPGSNRPPEAWKATALPNELLPLIHLCFLMLDL